MICFWKTLSEGSNGLVTSTKLQAMCRTVVWMCQWVGGRVSVSVSVCSCHGEIAHSCQLTLSIKTESNGTSRLEGDTLVPQGDSRGV